MFWPAALALKTKKTSYSNRSEVLRREVSVTLEPVAPVEESTSQPNTAESEFDWWSKYYTSLPNHPLKHTEYEDAGMDILKVWNSITTFSVSMFWTWLASLLLPWN